MPCFALVDCNNFYASCERVFAPRLEGRPVIVLSNNDGCVIARSPEAKAIGIPMAVPFFEVRALVRAHHVEVFSSNYALYGDMSRRIAAILARFAPRLELYSIDEAFLDLSNFRHVDPAAAALAIRRTVQNWTGIPVSIGIGPTKTLAKIANEAAKRSATAAHVFDASDESVRRHLLAETPAGHIWGVGRRWAAKLRRLGIESALQLRDADEHLIRQHFGVVMQRKVLELRGVSCLELCDVAAPRRNIAVSRSFRERVAEPGRLREAVTSYITRAGEKLRCQRSLAQCVGVTLYSKPRGIRKAASRSWFEPLPFATDDTGTLVRHALDALGKTYENGRRYHKAGVMLSNLIPAAHAAPELLETRDAARTRRLMQALDLLNERMGRGTVRYASEGFRHTWLLRSEHRSPRYTTRWDELPTARPKGAPPAVRSESGPVRRPDLK